MRDGYVLDVVTEYSETLAQVEQMYQYRYQPPIPPEFLETLAKIEGEHGDFSGAIWGFNGCWYIANGVVTWADTKWGTYHPREVTYVVSEAVSDGNEQ